MPHIFFDISSHGFGHLAQTAPVIDALHASLPELRLTLRCALPADKLRQRIAADFTHLQQSSDFGFRMIDALRIDHAASANAYRTAHRDFPARITAEAALLRELQVDAVVSNVSYLPLAGAAAAGIPALAFCSLNWADLFAHYFGNETWAAPIHAEILAAYRSATFLRTTPGMPMPQLQQIEDIGAIAAPGRPRREELCQRIGVHPDDRIVLVALGGIPARLPIEDWPATPPLRWLVPAQWLVNRRPARADFAALEDIGWPFVDLMRSVDAIVTKPGYGTFAEAACNGTAVLYQRRPDWPEQDCLIDWLGRHARCLEVTADDLARGALGPAIDRCLGLPSPTTAAFDGASMAAEQIRRLLY